MGWREHRQVISKDTAEACKEASLLDQTWCCSNCNVRCRWKAAEDVEAVRVQQRKYEKRAVVDSGSMPRRM